MSDQKNPVRLNYRQQGKGLPVVFLHGFPFDHTIWEPVIPYLQSEFLVILPDLRGLGKSPVSGNVSTMEAMAADIKALLDDLKIEKAVLAGHSMGGYVSMAFARAYPQRLAGLALVATHAAADTDGVRNNRLVQADEVQKCGAGLLAESMPGRLLFQKEPADEIKKLVMKMKPDGVSAAMRGMASRTASFDVLASLDVPVMVVAGQEDQIVSLKKAQELVEKMKNARLFEAPRCGHMPMLETPRLVAEALDWLAGQVKT